MTSHGPGREHPERKGLKPGAEVSLIGYPGRYTVHRIIGREVTCYGGKPGYVQHWRTVFIERVGTVHYRKPERRTPPAKLHTTPVAERLPDIDKGRAPARRRRRPT